MSRNNVASVAKTLLSNAAARLGVSNPLDDVSDIIDSSLAFPLGAQRADPLSPQFTETTPDHLAFVMTADAPGISPADRVESVTYAMSGLVGRSFGPEASRWLDGKLEPLRNHGYARRSGFGARFGSSFDRNGVTECQAQYEWGPQLMDTLMAPLYRLVRSAVDNLDGLRPVMSTIRCGRTSGSQQVSFELDRPLPLSSLLPLMEQLGLGHRHGGLMSAVAFVLGARFTLPAETALLTLRPLRTGVELRLDINLDALPDPPAQLMALMRLQMTERPKSSQGLDRWLLALTPDGYPGPGTASVLSVWVRPDLPARLALFLRPALFDDAVVAERSPRKVVEPVGNPMAQAAVFEMPAWAPLR
jgi:hypothetical protein